LLTIAENEALYALIGSTYGGDGVKTFALPDLRGRLPVGQGQGTNLTKRVIAQTGGSETVTLNEGQMPTHTHALTVATSAATTAQPSPTVTLATTATGSGFYEPATGGAVQALDANACMSSGNISPQGHANMMPSLCLTFIIALQGNYPQQ
jgi:microcystin-dependent protein